MNGTGIVTVVRSGSTISGRSGKQLIAEKM